MILIKDNFIKDKMLIEEAEIRGGGVKTRKDILWK